MKLGSQLTFTCLNSATETFPKLTKKLPKNINKVNANIYLFKVNDRSARKTCKTCPKLTYKTPEQRK